MIKDDECVWPKKPQSPVNVDAAKKRGRKPKVPVESIVASPPKVPVETKKRGRKPKAIVAVEPNSGDSGKIVVVEPNKRGRKPKVAEKNDTTIVKIDRKPKVVEESKDPKMDKPKRGRKPKELLKQEEAKNEYQTPKMSDVDYKDFIIEALEKLRKKEIANKQPFKARAYNVVLSQIKMHDAPIRSLDDVKNIKGIGSKIQDKLTEIFQTGDLRQLREYDSNVTMKTFEDLTKVHGIGPAKARELIDKNGITSIDQLFDNLDLLNDVQKKGLKYYKDFELRIPRAEMKKHEKYILGIIKKFGKKIQASLTGSFRREEPSSGDIDVLITGCDENIFENIIEKFKEDNYIVDVFAAGNKKILATCKLPSGEHFRRVDFMLTKENVYPFALLYFTGSGPFNVEMRKWALAKGYSLSEYGLKKVDEDEFVNHKFVKEEDIFEFLGIKYIDPKRRTHYVLESLP